MMHRNLLMAWSAAAIPAFLVGCIGHPPIQNGSRPFGQPQYITAPSGLPGSIVAPGPIAAPLPNSGPVPIASPPPGAITPEGGGLILTPASRTYTWKFPGYQSRVTPPTFAPIAYGPPGPRYADAGRSIDGRPISGSYASSTGAAGGVLSPGEPQIAGGLPATPAEDLKYRGGRAIKDLTYINIYIGGNQAWSESDRKNIDWALNAAMNDPGLNHVLMQYFNDEAVTANYRGSFILDGFRPQRVTQASLQDLLKALQTQGSFNQLPLTTTSINLFLPRGVVLEDPASNGQSNPGGPIVPQASSLYGLGGYHGSVHIGPQTLYYTVGTYAERQSNGQTNGVPVFNVPWKDICATIYHQMQDLRTDPDVDDVLSTGQIQSAGWVSENGDETSDFPVKADGADRKLDQVFVEVNLTNGSGRVPVQLCYSNAVHGPEGPLRAPHRGSPLPVPPATTPPWGASPRHPHRPAAGLIQAWNGSIANGTSYRMRSKPKSSG